MEQEYTKEVLKSAKKNIKIFPVYKMLSWDLLFYYAINFLFLTQVKGLSAAQFLYVEAFYTIFKILLQIPCTALIERIGNRNALIVGNIAVALHTFMLIFSNGISSVILANLIAAFGYNLKGIAESAILCDSVEVTNGKKSFSKTDGKGSAFYYYFEAITSVATGFLYVVNPYIPLVICLWISVISSIMSTRFRDIEIEKTETPTKNNTGVLQDLKNYIAELKHAFKYIFKSNRLRAFILFSFVFTGLLSLVSTYRKSLLADLNFPAQYLGIVFAVYGIISGIAAQNQHKFHEKFKNKTLAVLSLTLTISSIIIAIVVLVDLQFTAVISILLIIFALQHVIKGPYYTLQKKYMNNFSDSDIRPKIYSAVSLIESIGRTVISFIGGFLLTFMNTTFAFLVFGIISTAIVVFTLRYMKSRFGLKPEEYRKEDITYVALR